MTWTTQPNQPEAWASWLLQDGQWSDSGFWDDTQVWDDGLTWAEVPNQSETWTPQG